MRSPSTGRVYWEGAGGKEGGSRLGSARTMNLSLSTSPTTTLVSVQVKCQSKGDDEGLRNWWKRGPSKAEERSGVRLNQARQSHGAKG